MTSYSKLLALSIVDSQAIPFDAFECMAYEPIGTSSYCVYKSGPFQAYRTSLRHWQQNCLIQSSSCFIQLLRA
jgi:hypothetical protein